MRRERVLEAQRGTRALKIATVDEADRIGYEREARVQAAQASRVSVVRHASRQKRHTDAGERDRFDQLEISAGEASLWQKATLGEAVDDLGGLRDMPHVEERTFTYLESGANRKQVSQQLAIAADATGPELRRLPD